MPAAMLRDFQNQLIFDAGFDPRAGCSAGLFEILYGRRRDPWVIYASHITVAFFDVFRFADPELRAGIVHLWASTQVAIMMESEAAAAAAALSSSPPLCPGASTRWRRVAGTVTAYLDSLIDLGWSAPVARLESCFRDSECVKG